MSNTRNRFPARRRFLKQTALLSAGAASLTAPARLLARGEPPPQPAARRQGEAAPASAPGASVKKPKNKRVP